MSDGKWLLALGEPYASLYTCASCLAMADIFGDGDYKLLVADLGTGAYNMKLKVYKGSTLYSEHTLVDLPMAIVGFYTDSGGPKQPAVAVASGSCLFVYKNMRPFFKFSLPTLSVSDAEIEAWNLADRPNSDISALRAALLNIRVNGETLTARSEHFLGLANIDEAADFVKTYGGQPLRRQTVLTALATLNKSMHEEDAVTCLLLGTEARDVLILEPENFTVLAAMNLPSVSVLMDVSGLFDVEFRIIVACRDGCLYVLKRGQKTGKMVAELNSQAVGIAKGSTANTLMVGCMDGTLRCYSLQHTKSLALLWSLQLNCDIITLQSIQLKQLSLDLSAVCLSDGRVYLFQDKQVVDVIETGDPVTGLKFGRFGREDNVMVYVTKAGGLYVKILRRNAQFVPVDDTSLLPTTSGTGKALGKLNIPKKTKLFVDQTMREREDAVAMHRAFQTDLLRVRLFAAENTCQALETNLDVTTHEGPQIKLSARIQGLGPLFRLIIQMTAIEDKPELDNENYLVAFHYDPKIYKVDPGFRELPWLIPGIAQTVSTSVHCISELNLSDIIRVLLIQEGNSVPVLTALISLPVGQPA